MDASDASGESEMKYYSKLVNQGLYNHEVKFTYQLVFFCDVSVQKKQHDPVIVQNQCGINVLLETPLEYRVLCLTYYQNPVSSHIHWDNQLHHLLL